MISNAAKDRELLRRAFDLACQGVGLAAPNPQVGAVIVDGQNNIVGEGIYTYRNVKHAEIVALEKAGARARGGTLYINLEPHAHQGRTPPCTDALIAAGIRRVVASMADPNPKVSGLGFEKLRAAGIEVEVGGLKDEAQRLNEAFARYIRDGRPFVTLKSAMTLDGKIAPSPGWKNIRKEGIPPGGWITGDTARAHVHELRHAADAILVGVGTILADDPLLTDRSGRTRRRALLRIVLDSHLRLPLHSRLVRSVVRAVDGTRESDIVVFHTRGSLERVGALESAGVRVEQVAGDEHNRPELNAVLDRLGQLEIIGLIIEGGASVNGAALAAGIVDKLFLYYAAKIMGDDAAVPFARGWRSPLPMNVRDSRVHHFGEDFAVEGYLRDAYSG